MKFLKPNDPSLRKIAENVDPASKGTQKAIKTMLKIIRGEQKEHKRGVGLAAPQIGISKRIILVDVAADGKGKTGDLRVFVNPEIVWKSKRKGEWYECCYSTGKICGIVSRPVSIKIKSLNLHSRSVSSKSLLEWKVVQEKWTGYVARIFQHEIDHLDGKVFTSRITNPDHLHLVEKKEFPLYRNKMAWKTWPKKLSGKARPIAKLLKS